MSIFEKASRQKLRFETRQGLISAEELWDLSLSSLDTLAKSVNKRLKEESEESFISEKSSSNTELDLKLEILKHVIQVKLKEKEDSKNRAEKRSRIEFLEGLLAKKTMETLEGQTADEIAAQLELLKSEV